MADPVRGSRPAGTATPGILLCADDYALTNGISRAIIELASAGRLSATSAMTTSAHWPSHATWIARERGGLSVGLHVNLTLGAPLGVMAKLAPDRRFPTIGNVIARALRGTLDGSEIAAEIDRQCSAFEAELGFPPDHVDGHQHVHVLPGVRKSLLSVLARRYAGRRRPLVRVPGNGVLGIADGRVRGPSGIAKAAVLTALTAGFASAARAAGFVTNQTFGGLTSFSADRVDADFAAAVGMAPTCRLVMCHPGFVDDELRRIDPILERRQREFDTLMAGGFPATVWRPARSAVGEPINWTSEWAGRP